MNDAAARAQETLDAWRTRGADRLDPMRFRFIDALRRRAADHTGDARRILDARLSALIDAYADDLRRASSAADAAEDAASALESASASASAPASAPASASASASAPALTPALESASMPASTPTPAPPAPARGPLAALLDYIGGQARPNAGGPSAGANDANDAANRNRRALRAEPDMLDYFRQTWSKVSADSQLLASLEQVPKNAGPLNSSSLVHRSLSLMRELSPEYLRQFLSYVDALSWLEQMNGDDDAASGDAARAGSAATKKGARRKSR